MTRILSDETRAALENMAARQISDEFWLATALLELAGPAPVKQPIPGRCLRCNGSGLVQANCTKCNPASSD